jgi:DHA1 family bicyclomycin/chloramphenicol resistance-like MFS transporter
MSGDPTTRAAVTPAISPGRMAVVGAFLIALGPISMNLYTPALTRLAAELATTDAMIKASVSAYLFGFALAQLVCGPLSDRFGRRPVLIGCLCLYLVGAALGGIAESGAALLAARLVQGIGACASVALSRVMVADQFEGDRAARIMSLMSMILSLAPAAAPVIGGALVVHASWRFLFVAMAAYGAALLIVAWRLPETHRTPDPYAIRPRRVLANYVYLMTSPPFLGDVLLSALMVGGYYTVAAVAPFVLMGRIGLSPTQFGAVSACYMGAYFAGALATNRLLLWISAARLIRLGLVLVAGGAIALSLDLLVQGASTLGVVGATCVWVFGMAFIVPGLTMSALRRFPKMSGAAAAAMGCLQMSTGFAGSALVTVFTDSVLAMATIPPAMALLGVAAYLIGARRAV